MAEKSKISWTDSAGRHGCQNVSPGCGHCYAEAWASRYRFVEWGTHAERRLTAASPWKELSKWSPIVDGHRRRIFVAELADIFDNKGANLTPASMSE